MTHPNDTTIDDGFGHWLAGFIDGEGSFTVQGRQPRLAIQLREDDTEILREILTRTGLGHFRCSPKRPVCIWEIWRLDDAIDMVGILDAHPLRARKARDYRIWREVVFAVRDRQHDRLEQLKQDLVAARAFVAQSDRSSVGGARHRLNYMTDQTKKEIHRLREAGKTQNQIADALGVCQSRVSRVLSGK